MPRRMRGTARATSSGPDALTLPGHRTGGPGTEVLKFFDTGLEVLGLGGEQCWNLTRRGLLMEGPQSFLCSGCRGGPRLQRMEYLALIGPQDFQFRAKAMDERHGPTLPTATALSFGCG